MNVSEIISYVVSLLDAWGFSYFLAALIVIAAAIQMLKWLGVLKD